MFMSAFFFSFSSASLFVPRQVSLQSYHHKPLPCRWQLLALQHFKSRLPDLKEKKKPWFFFSFFATTYSLFHSPYITFYFFLWKIFCFILSHFTLKKSACLSQTKLIFQTNHWHWRGAVPGSGLLLTNRCCHLTQHYQKAGFQQIVLVFLHWGGKKIKKYYFP